MTLNDQLTLSFYQPIAEIDASRGIFLVQHTDTNKIYIKKILTVYSAAVYRQLREHPVKNTPRICEVIEDEEQKCLIVIEEYLSGQTLADIMDVRGLFHEEEVLAIMRQLCTILQGLHSANPPIIHRDIKPSNLMLSSDGKVWLLDMNAAHQYRSDTGKDTRLIGTAGYAAPEQYGFRPSDRRTDIYATGVLMNVLLTGKTPEEIITSGSLRPVIECCTRMDPADRYPDVTALLAALDTALLAALDNAAAESSSGMTSSDLPTLTSDSSDPTEDGILYMHSADEIELRHAEVPRPAPWRRFLPPGFRSGTAVRMIPALGGYVMLTLVSAQLQVGTGAADIFLNRIMFWLTFVFVILFTGNYLGIRNHVPLCSSRSRLLRILGTLLVDIGIVFGMTLILVCIEDFIF